MLFLKNNTSKKIISMMLAFFSIFFLMSGEFLVKVRASEKTIFSLTQTTIDRSPTVMAVSKDMYINDLSAIKRLVFSYGNTERHWYCDECGSIRASTTVTIDVLGYLKEDGREESIARYTLSGLDNASPKRATSQLIFNDNIKSKYYNIKIAAYLSSCTAGRCSHDEPIYTYHSNGTGYVSVVADTYDEPVIQTNGNLSNKTLTEGIADYIGIVDAYFPGNNPKYNWQYSEGGSWINIENGKTSYATATHGTLELSDKNGGSSFLSSNALKLNNPEVKMTGISFRVVLSSDGSASSTVSNSSNLTVSSRNAGSFYSARYANRYGQEGERAKLSDVIAFVRFNNGQIVDAQKLLNEDKRVSFYGFINPSNISGKSVEEVLSGLKAGSISYTESGDNAGNLLINSGNNDFYLKLTYNGTAKAELFTAISFEGKDEVSPDFSENVMLYESDGLTLYTRGNYKISNESAASLRIMGSITDSVSDDSKISWAYTLTKTGDGNNEVKIPVYRQGTAIDVKVEKNGTYTLYAQDSAGNTANKVITVNAFDENYPTLNIEATPSPMSESNIVKSYTITALGEDVERLAAKPYFYKRFVSMEEAESFNESNISDNDFSKGNSFLVTSEGYYLIAVKDAVGKITKEIIHLPEDGREIDYSRPEIAVNPVAIKELSGKLTEYDVDMMDNLSICKYEITNQAGNVIVSKSAENGDFEKGKKIINYRFVPTKAGEYRIKVYDYADNTSELSVNVTIREVESVTITGIGDTMSVNSEVSLENLIGGGSIILNMNDGTSEIYSERDDIDIKLIDKNGNETDKLLVDYGDNSFKLVVTVNPGKENENVIEYVKTIYGEDNVAPLPGQLKEELTNGWDGGLTNNLDNTMTFIADGCEDDGSSKDKLIVTWYRDDEIVQQKSVAEGGDVFGPFSGEEYNGNYRYTVTDEKGNISHSVQEKLVDCYDLTPPVGELKLLPEGTTADSMARYKQLQIINASDNVALAARPYSFTGNNDEAFTIISSVVAGENGKYDVYIKDSAGNVTSLGEIILTGIDSTAPTINGYEVNEDEEGRKILHVDAYDTDSNGNESQDIKYSIDGENYQDSPDFEVTESGQITIYVKDETGNVTKTSTDYTDVEAPSIIAYQDENGAGVIIVNVTDNTGLSKVVMEDDKGNREILQIYDGVTQDTISKEIGRTGDYVITVWDQAGNSEKATVNVPSIAPLANSSILTGLKLSPSSWTSADVMVIAQLGDTQGLSSAPFRWNNSISTANAYYVVTENKDVSVDISDIYGNVIATQTVKVSNIDRINPVIESLYQSEDKNHLVIKTYDSESGIAQVTISGGPYSVETNVVVMNGENNPEDVVLTLPTNGSYTVRVYDRAGNAAQKKITVSGVTTDVPKIEYREVVKTVDNVVTKDRVVTQNVEKPVPVVVPVPVKETVTQYKTLRDNGEDTTTLIKGDSEAEETNTIIENSDLEHQRVEKEQIDSDEQYAQHTEAAIAGTYTKDGTYIAPDGYEYYGRVDARDKDEHPFKYFFKKNAEKIAAIATVLSLLLLILCIVLLSIILKDYFADQNDKRTIKKLRNKEDNN